MPAEARSGAPATMGLTHEQAFFGDCADISGALREAAATKPQAIIETGPNAAQGGQDMIRRFLSWLSPYKRPTLFQRVLAIHMHEAANKGALRR